MRHDLLAQRRDLHLRLLQRHDLHQLHDPHQLHDTPGTAGTAAPAALGSCLTPERAQPTKRMHVQGGAFAACISRQLLCAAAWPA